MKKLNFAIQNNFTTTIKNNDFYNQSPYNSLV